MPVNIKDITNVLTRNIHTTYYKCGRLAFTTNSKIATVIITITLINSLSVVINNENFGINNDVYAQFPQAQQRNDTSNSQDNITIQLNSIKFAPLTNSDNNQLKVLADYKTNDPALVNTHMDGVMKVYNPEGTLLKTSTIQKGFVLGESGVIQFATSFADQTIRDVNTELALTDAFHAEKISNTLKSSASLEK